jgi:serine protease inhibitor ecotin
MVVEQTTTKRTKDQEIISWFLSSEPLGGKRGFKKTKSITINSEDETTETLEENVMITVVEYDAITNKKAINKAKELERITTYKKKDDEMKRLVSKTVHLTGAKELKKHILIRKSH